MATLEARATSFRIVATPPRVASRITRTPVVASRRTPISSARGAVSDSMSLSMSSSPRASMMVTPWSPIGPDTRTASPGRTVPAPRVMSRSMTPMPAVLM